MRKMEIGKARIMHKLRRPIPPPILTFLFLFLGIVGCGGCDTFLDQDLAGGYRALAIDTMEQTMIVNKTNGGPAVVDPMVFAYGWNKDFIIAKQHPEKNKPSFVIDTNITNWFIIEIASRKVHGPLTEKAYLE